MTIRNILENSTTIAVVGASKDPRKAAGGVPLHLQKIGYRVIPVNPSATELYGEKAYPNLAAVGEPVDVVQVFRPSEEAPEIARQAVQIGAKVLLVAAWYHFTRGARHRRRRGPGVRRRPLHGGGEPPLRDHQASRLSPSSPGELVRTKVGGSLKGIKHSEWA